MNRSIDEDNEQGQHVGAKPGNKGFRLRGKPNQLSDVGKAVLERMQSGKYKGTVWPFSRLDFYAEHARCMRERILFEDPEFPANDSSLYYKEKPGHAIVWRRPGEMKPEPRLIAEGHSRFDVKQGHLGDCWFMAAAASITLHDGFFYQVVPPDQDFTPENYAGIFHFRFWRYGEWVDVVIDDRLPFCEEPKNKYRLHFARSMNHNEFWSALLEKAYAKMHGSYEHIRGGWTSDALVDFTEGIPQYDDIKSFKRDELINVLSRVSKDTLLGASKKAPPNEMEKIDEETDLVSNHAYSITGFETLTTKHGQLVLVRLRNPWGSRREWLGRYSDDSPEWNNVPEDKRKHLLLDRKDGEFWMHIDDFIEHFDRLHKCHLTFHGLKEIELLTGMQQSLENKPMFDIAEHGSWCYKDRMTRSRCNPIKCADRKGCLAVYPQYLLTVESGPGSAGQQKESLIMTLLQKYRREQKTKGVRDLHIGFSIYKAPKGTNSRVDETFIKQNKAITESRKRAFREMMFDVTLDPAEYIIIPCKSECCWDGEFLMRIASNARLHSRLLK